MADLGEAIRQLSGGVFSPGSTVLQALDDYHRAHPETYPAELLGLDDRPERIVIEHHIYIHVVQEAPTHAGPEDPEQPDQEPEGRGG